MMRNDVHVVKLPRLLRALTGNSSVSISIPALHDKRWSTGQQLEFLGNLAHGYPFGQVTVWQTDERIPCRDDLGASDAAGDGGGRTYLVDGYQRISAVAEALLGPGVRDPGDGALYPVFADVSCRSRGVFRCWPESDARDRPELVPASSLLDTIALLAAQERFPDPVRDAW